MKLMPEKTMRVYVIALTGMSWWKLGESHGINHDQKPILAPGESDWATIHMAEEHHIANVDPPSFFKLHDFNGNGEWSKEEIRRIYGYNDESAKTLTEDKKQEGVSKVMAIFDSNNDGSISRDEFVHEWTASGKRLPDLGTGPGHHGDDEYEYEIHHFEKFHDENTREEDLIHPEDIAHFKKHDEMDAAAERQETMDRVSIVEANIPAKFRRQ